jgi:hypothetical protein
METSTMSTHDQIEQLDRLASQLQNEPERQFRNDVQGQGPVPPSGRFYYTHYTN